MAPNAHDNWSYSSTLDPSETTPHALQTQSECQHRIHAPTWEARARAIGVFEASGDSALQKRAVKMGLCCVAPILRVEKGRTPVLCPGRCRDRMCPLCCRQRGWVARERIRGLVLKADSVRMITLTRKGTDEALGTVIASLLKCFQRLRRSVSWKRHVRGGLYVIEFTRGEKGDHWHVHLHVLADGTFYDGRTLTADWSLACGQPAGTDVRAVHSRVQAATYITKYVTKGADTVSLSDDLFVEMARGLHRVRLYGTFGTWHRVDVARDDDDQPDPKCPSEGISMQQVVQALRSGTLDHREVVPLLHRLGHVCKRIIAEFPYQPPALLIPVAADDWEPLTLWALEVVDRLPPPPLPPGPTLADVHNGRLFTQHHT